MAERAPVWAATANGTRSGSSRRASAVAIGSGATRATATRSGWTGTARQRGRPSSTQARVAPPYRQGVALSGWPSSSQARASSSESGRSGATSRRAAVRPRTTAAALEPKPRPSGKPLTTDRCSGGRSAPASAARRRMATATRLPGPVGSSSACSPLTWMASTGARRTSSSSHQSRAIPAASNAGPRLALVAGARTRTTSLAAMAGSLADGGSRSGLGLGLGLPGAQGDLLEQQGDHEGDDQERHPDQEHVVQGVGEGAEDDVPDRLGQLLDGLDVVGVVPRPTGP